MVALLAEEWRSRGGMEESHFVFPTPPFLYFLRISKEMPWAM